jgi:outer membrane protein OmpA-like peptidoglycan-associated protein
MSAIRCYLSVVVFVATIPGALRAQDALSAPQARITDQVIVRDRAVLAAWQRRLDSLNARGDAATAFHRAKAAAWLELVRTEYSDNDRTGIVESGFTAATQIIRDLEAGKVPSLATTMVPGSQRVLDSLWQRADERRADPDAATAADARILGQLDVELIWAGNEALTCGPFDARPHEEEARRLAALLLTYQPPLPPAPQPPPPPPPPVDSDGDGVFDPADRCPGTRLGATVDAKGCTLLVVEDTTSGAPRRPLVLRGVNFETGRADLKPESSIVLDDVAASLLANEDVRIEIAGHTDSQGARSFNQVLSSARAETVRRYLIAKGVAADRMRAQGYGEDQPMATNATAAGRAQNRRVELHKLP